MGASAASNKCLRWCQFRLPWLSRKYHQVRRCLRKTVVGRQTPGNNRPRLFLFSGSRESSAGVTSAAWGNQAGNHDHWNNAESRPIKTVEPHHFIDFAFTLNGFRHRNAGRRQLSVEQILWKGILIDTSAFRNYCVNEAIWISSWNEQIVSAFTTKLFCW